LRPEIIDKGCSLNPGPGNYDPVQSQTKNKDPAFKIGTGKRDFQVSSKGVPGPGNYDPKSELNKRGAGIGYGKKRAFDDVITSPGPGQYDIDRSVNPLPPYARNNNTLNQQVSVRH